MHGHTLLRRRQEIPRLEVYPVKQHDKSSSPQHLEILQELKWPLGSVLVPGNAFHCSQGSLPPGVTGVRELLQSFVHGEHAVPPVFSILLYSTQCCKDCKRNQTPPHITQKRRIEDIMPLIEKRGTQETLWYIYIFLN